MKEFHPSQKQTKMVIASPDFILAHLLPADLTKKASESSTQTSLSGVLASTFPATLNFHSKT